MRGRVRGKRCKRSCTSQAFGNAQYRVVDGGSAAREQDGAEECFFCACFSKLRPTAHAPFFSKYIFRYFDDDETTNDMSRG